MLAIPFQIFFFLLFLGIVCCSVLISGHVPCLLQACPCHALFSTRPVERDLFRVCFFELFVPSVKFVVALWCFFGLFRHLFSIVLLSLLNDELVRFRTHCILILISILQQTFPAANTCLVILPRSAEWLDLGWIFAPLAEYLQGLFSLPDKGIFEPLAKYFHGPVTLLSVDLPKTIPIFCAKFLEKVLPPLFW